MTRDRSYLVQTLAAIALCLISANLWATVSTGTKPIEDKFAGADFVCLCVPVKVAQVNSQVNPKGEPAVADFEVTVRIVRLYKGPAGTSDIVIRFAGKDPMMGAPLQKNSPYVLFLRQVQGNHYEASDGANPASGLLPLGPPTQAGGGPVQLENETQEALAKSSDAVSMGLLLRLLTEFRTHSLSRQTVASLERISEGSSSDLVLLSLEILCETVQGPEKYLPKLTTSLLDFENLYPTLSAAGLDDSLAGICDLLANSSTARDIEGLEKLSNSHISGIGVCALLGIRRLKDPKTIPFLIAELDSTNQQIQYEAVITLAELTGKGGDYGPGMGMFLSAPQKYTSLWKSWYKTR